MSVNPINLSIMIGDGTENGTPHLTPRNSTFRSVSPTKSCVKTRIASLTPPVSMKPNNKFRQWADPPPPPTRSRTAERKSSTGIKRRTGSVDSRFRRTLTDISKDNLDKKKTFDEIKNEFLYSSRTLKVLNENETPKQQSEMTDVSCLTNSTENQISTITEIETKTEKNDYKSIYHTLEPPISKYKVNNDLEKNSTFDFSDDSSVSEIFNNHKTAGYNQLKPKPCVNVDSILFKEPQTEIIFGRNADNFSQTNISIASKIKYDDKSSSDLFGLKEDESFISDVYSKDSRETIDTEANYTCKNCSNRRNLNNRYLRYLEIWSTILTLSTFGALTWVYVAPYIQEYVTYFYYTHINPKPEPPNSIFDYFYQFYEFIEDVISTPAHTRIKYFK